MRRIDLLTGVLMAVCLTTPVLAEEPTFEDMNCLALNVYHEARDQPIEGQLAVAYVTLNRVVAERFPDTICEVVWDRKQFSWTNDGKSDDPTDWEAWLLAQRVAQSAVSDRDNDPTEGALFYHADDVSPFWADPADVQIVIAQHVFYR